MFIKVLKSKLHRAVVTNTRTHYPGSIAIDSDLMEAADIVPYESVLVADLTNGNRLETYAVPAEAGSGKVVILGAAAHLIKRRDVIIIFSFGYYSPEEAKKLKPKILLLDQNNKIKKVS
ncbi:MAG: aspartate 1-decarboxylase [Planctomycetota bacterium]|jgi:aspartate 1-decarboxylase